jgi:hypothetical protein
MVRLVDGEAGAVVAQPVAAAGLVHRRRQHLHAERRLGLQLVRARPQVGDMVRQLDRRRVAIDGDMLDFEQRAFNHQTLWLASTSACAK